MTNYTPWTAEKIEIVNLQKRNRLLEEANANLKKQVVIMYEKMQEEKTKNKELDEQILKMKILQNRQEWVLKKIKVNSKMKKRNILKAVDVIQPEQIANLLKYFGIFCKNFKEPDIDPVRGALVSLRSFLQLLETRTVWNSKKIGRLVDVISVNNLSKFRGILNTMQRSLGHHLAQFEKKKHAKGSNIRKRFEAFEVLTLLMRWMFFENKPKPIPDIPKKDEHPDLAILRRVQIKKPPTKKEQREESEE